MRPATRTVERLRLRADSEAAVRRALPVLEDAFRTATLPDRGARLVFVRRLNLGRVPRGASAQSLSLLVASRVTDAGWTLVHAGDAGANEAEAVWFRDSLEAHELAALRVAGGRAVDAWFWPLAVPVLARATSAADRLRGIAFSLAAHEEAPAALPAWVTSLVRAEYGETVIAALRPGDSTALRRAAGLHEALATAPTASEKREEIKTARPSRGHTRPAQSGVEFSQRSAAAELDDRVALVEQIVAGPSGRPSRPPSPSVSTLPASATHATLPFPAADERAIDHQVPQPARTLARADLDVAVTAAPPDRPGTSERRSDPRRDPGSTEESLNRSASETPATVRTAQSPWVSSDAAPTGAGGLLFLVPALERLGFGEWCATLSVNDPQPDVLARQIFHTLLTRLRIADEDAAWQLAEAEPAAAAIRLKPDDFSPALWLARCRRVLRLRARIGLASLVLRPARIGITATHLDVFFSPGAADVRIRRAGLDIDPGWVPWLRRVVTFHYGQELR